MGLKANFNDTCGGSTKDRESQFAKQGLNVYWHNAICQPQIDWTKYLDFLKVPLMANYWVLAEETTRTTADDRITALIDWLGIEPVKKTVCVENL